MSTDTGDRHSPGAAASIGAALEHPLVGRYRRRTALTIAYLGGLVAMFAGSYLGARVSVGGDVLDTVSTKGFDALSMVFIAFVMLTLLIVPVCYALWNGGPGMAALLPLVPVALGDLVVGSYVLDLDLATGLTVGASAAALALVATDARRAGSLRFWEAPIDDDGLLFVTAVSLVGAFGVARFVAAAPTYVYEWYAPFGTLWLVPAGVVGSYWLRRLRSVWRPRTNTTAD
ncbi:hypothetical protein C488_18890 [Natrinema pellirubrum DSM 15624]|uniref:Uncharacterized protein n=1 Tax=Natrinema pellirubrum (strain DSM 15624 / CIP 106293 / JCM 10476 / NCIMB 786 / 157) TaxID=797303 RepID=L0JI08_NATP1|nr:hypothetical protein [Natrinema pellirubrum]AGB29966.1 hypothetical protein Natpe_0015 [Natrinema pellirubrum DSM 15624]ELY70510.1 hypothetical protein C488_18890 [Natrinema pellirubrum DSM 15624]